MFRLLTNRFLKDETRIYRAFLVSISITVGICLAVVFLGVAVKTRNLIMQEVSMEARALIKSIIFARKWNASYGGVYVEKTEGVESNPYIENPDITVVDGRVFTLRNPAMMSREISEYSEGEGLFSFRLASLRPVNPANAPDEFEREALLSFEEGAEESSAIEEKDGKTYFEYMVPLYVEEDCLWCHAQHGYKLGEVRGGISVRFDIQDIRDKLRTNFIHIGALGLATTMLLLGVVYFLTSKLMKRIASGRETIERMAITDGLTGLYNRRHVMSRFAEEFERARRTGENLGCILLDIDHFKRINDTHGHLYGDRVLRETSEVIKLSIRLYDIPGRFGGEEFLIVMPDAEHGDVVSLAERIRKNIKENPFLERDSLTVSLGAVSMEAEDRSVDDILMRADEGLYRAKKAGRDRVASA